MVPLEKLLTGAREHRSKTGRPLIMLSYAQSLDGCIAAQPGEKLVLSGPESMALTHQLRARHDAILVGIGTVLIDDPRLNVRLVKGQDPQTIVMDSHLQTPIEANLLQNSRKPWIACLDNADPSKAKALEAAGANLLRISADSAGRVSAPVLLERLAGLEINSLMVEGGANVIGTFLQMNLVDRILLTIAPVFLGGLRAVGLDVFSARSNSKSPYPGLREMGVELLGNDLIVWGSPKASV